ncbi:MAG: hypothetical protein GF350_16265 [Chitinivibrionales bacterium]|nr:hypothetical protein [Chitinivibrionales bacterium]
MNVQAAITGMGIVCGAGTDVESFRHNIIHGIACFRRITDKRLTNCTACYASLLDVPVSDMSGGSGEEQWCDPVYFLSLKAAQQALEDASVSPGKLKERVGLFFATCSGPMLSIERHYENIAAGDQSISPRQLFGKKYYSIARMLCNSLDISGLHTTVVTACSSSLGAVGLAADCIRLGIIDVALAGGADTFSPSTLMGFDGLRATTPEICAPFSLPPGLNLGEGAAFLVLEEPSFAKHRSARIRGMLCGYGLSNDAYHCSAPDPSGKGQAAAMKRALAHADVAPSGVGYINAHGTGTEANDKSETKAIRRAMQEHAGSVPVSSSKSVTGHCLGAAGAVETIAALAAAEKNSMPPTANFSRVRDGCELQHVDRPGMKWGGPKLFVNNSFAFGGNNAAGIFQVGAAAAEQSGHTGGKPALFITAIEGISVAGVGIAALNAGCSRHGPGIAGTEIDGIGQVLVAAVPEFNPDDIDRRLDLRGVDRAGMIASATVRHALNSAGITRRTVKMDSVGFIMSLADGANQAEEEFVGKLYRDTFKLESVNAFPFLVPNSVSGAVCRSLMLTGYNTTICSGEGAGITGLGMAANAVAAGHCESCVSCSIDTLFPRRIIDMVLSGAIDRDRYVFGEGAVACIVETATAAKARNAEPIAEIVSRTYATETRTVSGTDTDHSAVRSVIGRALDDAGIGREDLHAVCCSHLDKQSRAVLKNDFAVQSSQIFDTAGITGVLPAAGAVFSLGIVLNKLSQENKTRYVLALVRSSHGSVGCCICKTLNKGTL